MFKCKEQVSKYNPSKLSTLSYIVCYNNKININSLKTVKFVNEPVQVIYRDFCLVTNCYLNITHDHIENINKHRYTTYKDGKELYSTSLVDQILPFQEFSSNQVDEQRRRAVKRKLNF